MRKILIVDDERPARRELSHQLSELLQDAQIEEGDSGETALKKAEEEQYELIFLDINLGDISGTAIVNAIRTMQKNAKIVFVTAYTEYAVKAFELGVEDYVLKPFDTKRLKKVLDKCLVNEEKVNAKIAQKIAINADGKMIFEKEKDIVYIETYNRGCLVHMAETSYVEGRSIGELEKKLDPSLFFRCHKSFLVNLNKIHEIFPWNNNSLGIKLEGYEKEILPVSREKSKQLKRLLYR